MIRSSSATLAVLVPVLCPVLLLGCLFPASHGHGDRNAGLGAAGAGSPPIEPSYASPQPGAPGSAPVSLPAPFTEPLKSVVTQPVRWAGLNVSVTGARLVRGLSTQIAAPTYVTRYAGASPGYYDPAKVYAILALELTNKSAEEQDYNDRSSWDLLLADGTRLESLDRLDLSVLPGETGTTSLHYETSDKAVLAGAQLVLNGEDRTRLEPEKIPLDAAVAQDFPRRITSLVGQTASFKDNGGGRATVHIDEAVYDLNYKREARAAAGKRVVWLTLAFTPTSSSEAFVSMDSVRVAVDGRAVAPHAGWYDFEIIDAGTTIPLSGGFEIDATASDFEIMIPDGTPMGQRFPVKVADTVLATDLP